MATAQPAPAASAPQTSASAPQKAASPLPAASAPNTASVTVQPNAQTIAITLQPEAKPTSWTDPSVLTPAVAFLVFLFSIWSTQRNLAQSAENTNKQLKAAAENLDKQLKAASEAQDRQLKAAAEATERQLRAAQEVADAKMAHDREEARIVRLMNARRDIFVEIMADYQKVQQFIGSLANEDAKFEQRALLSVMSASVNKLWIWGEVDTAYKMREFYTQVNEFYFAALARALALKKTRDFIAALLRNHAPLKAKAQEIGEKLRDVNSQPEHAKRDPVWLQIHNRLSGEHYDAVREEQQLMSLIVEFSANVSKKENEYLDFVIERQTYLNNQVNIVMASARADVGLQGDTTKLDEQTHEMGQRVRDALERYKEFHQTELRDMNMQEDDD